jgi:hypothetical protein
LEKEKPIEEYIYKISDELSNITIIRDQKEKEVDWIRLEIKIL